MDELNSIITLKDYGKINIRLAELLEQRHITRNRLRTLTGIKYDVIDRYYKNDNIERIDVDFLAKVCFVLGCSISELLEYEKD